MKYFLILFFVLQSCIFAQNPGAFSLTLPANGNFSNVTPLFQWGSSSGVSYYQLYIDGGLKKDLIPSNSYQLVSTESLTEGLHTWNVVAKNGSGNTSSNETWSVRIDGTPPAAFDLVSPSDNSWTNNLTPTFQWNASSDAGSGLSKYQLWVDNALNLDNISIATTSALSSYPLSNGSHTWQIKAIDNVGNVSNSTQTWSVNVDNTPPGLSDNCVYFDGTNDYAITSTNVSINGAMTMEAWVKPNGSGERGIAYMPGCAFLKITTDNKISYVYYQG